MRLDEVIAFARAQGYESAEGLGRWRGYDAYEPIPHGDEQVFTGPPLMILVKGEDARMSTPEEAYAQIGIR